MSARLPDLLRHETRELHLQVEQSEFMGELLRGTMARFSYVLLIRNLHAIYAALEPALRRNIAHPAIAPLVLPGLWREQGLEWDLEFLDGSGWRRLPLQSATLVYVARLNDLEALEPALLAAHSYVRYLGDLSGGQILARTVRKNLALQSGGKGTAFYDFGDLDQVADLKKAYRAALADLALDAPSEAALVVEARWAFSMHAQLFEQLATAATFVSG